MDADRKKVTWKNLYKNLYKESDWYFWKLLDFDNPNENGEITWKNENDPIWNTNKEYNIIKNKYLNFKISGDTDWTLNSKIYEKYFQNTNEEIHKFQNFSLMPVKGGMNCRKGIAYKDRLDVFISVLAKYYKYKSVDYRYKYAKEKLCKYNSKTDITLIYLLFYLDLFKDIYDYCEKIYFIPKEFVDKLIKYSKRNSKINKNNAESYCDLIKEYWQIRTEFMKKRIPIKEQYYITKDISKDDYK